VARIKTFVYGGYFWFDASIILTDVEMLLLLDIYGSLYPCIHPYIHIFSVLVKLLENVEEDETVLSNVVGALYECLKFEHNRSTLRRANGIPHLVNLLNYTYPPLLENVPKVLKECAEDNESMRIIEELDGVRLIWSLLKK
ncbi:hypothetical protein NQ318_008151, partial [Aromia moschata]